MTRLVENVYYMYTLMKSSPESRFGDGVHCNHLLNNNKRVEIRGTTMLFGYFCLTLDPPRPFCLFQKLFTFLSLPTPVDLIKTVKLEEGIKCFIEAGKKEKKNLRMET